MKISVLSGAGVSALSGIKPYTVVDAEWKHDRPRVELASIYHFKDDPAHFWEIFNELHPKENIEPNIVHESLANLENTHEVTIITQNIDGLHQKAGNTNVIELHGNLLDLECVSRMRIGGCGNVYQVEQVSSNPPICPNCGNILKPSVSLYGEGINGRREAQEAIVESDLFIVIGTSLRTGPANELALIGYPYKEKPLKAWFGEFNPPADYDFNHVIVEPFSNSFPNHLANIVEKVGEELA